MEVPLLGQDKEEKELELVEADAAFLVMVKDGQVVMSTDINIPITVERQPTLHEIRGACYNVLTDLQNQETAMQSAQHTVNFQLQAARQMSEARTNQQLLEKLPGGLAK